MTTKKTKQNSKTEEFKKEDAAVAFALHLYEESLHDKESGKLTINSVPSRWCFELNPRM